MATITSGSNATGSFVTVDSVTVSTRGNAKFECPVGTVVAEFTGTRTFGPYSGQSYKITATVGDAYYETADGNTLTPVSADATGNLYAGQSPVSGAGTQIVNAGTAGSDSGWVVYTPGMRLAYALDSGSTSTTFSVDISADGSVSLGQAFSGTWASTTAEISPPIYLSNPQARFIRFNVLTGGPLSVIRF